MRGTSPFSLGGIESEIEGTDGLQGLTGRIEYIIIEKNSGRTVARSSDTDPGDTIVAKD